MPAWLLGNLHFVIAAIVTAAVLGYLRSRGVRRRVRALREGRPTSFEAFLRGSAPPYPPRWRYGWVEITLGGPTWKPRFSFVRRPIALPANATVESIRKPRGFMENLRTNPECRIVVARAETVTLELAIVMADIPTALESLSSGAGAQWKTPLEYQPG